MKVIPWIVAALGGVAAYGVISNSQMQSAGDPGVEKSRKQSF